MPTRKLKIVVTRKLPAAVELRMKELFDARLNEPSERKAELRIKSAFVLKLEDDSESVQKRLEPEQCRARDDYALALDKV